MTAAKNKFERIGISVLLCIALSTFLSPLVRLRGPDGELAGDGPDIRSDLTVLRTSLSGAPGDASSPKENNSDPAVRNAPTTAQPVELPYSLQNAQFTSWLIFAALLCAVLALTDLLLAQKKFATLSLLGGCLAAIAVLHVMLMSSDLRTWTNALGNGASPGTQESPLLAARMSFLNSFLVNPGPGLYVLSSCLILVPFLSSSQSYPRVKSAERGDPRTKVSQPVRVRPLNSRYPEEICTSLNVSRSGLQIETGSTHYFAGMEVYLVRNAEAAEAGGPEEHGCVVRVEKPQDGNCRVAIRLISAP